jgi:hypothetical protein
MRKQWGLINLFVGISWAGRVNILLSHKCQSSSCLSMSEDLLSGKGKA